MPITSTSKCDFCSQLSPRFVYPCPGFSVDGLEGFPAGWNSTGDWAACATCAGLIEAEQWDALEARAIVALEARAGGRVSYTGNMRRVHAVFRERRSGPRQAIPPLVPPTTMASVYSRALDEQARLVATLARPEMHRAMLDAVTRAHGPEAGQRLLDLTYASVAQSEAGYVSRLVCQILAQTSASIPEVTLEPEQLLTPNGFLLLQEPFELGEAQPEGLPVLGPVRCLSWFGFSGDEHAEAAPRGGIFAVAWCDQGGYLAPLMANWAYGETWAAAANDRRTEAERLVAAKTLRWLAALNAFCEQKLLTGRRGPAERATRRRIERSGREPSDVLVVELRRVDQRSHEPSGDHRQVGVDFSFTISGHWRHQYYPSLDDHRPRWIFPYVKGNLEAPLRQRRRVFAIVH